MSKKLLRSIFTIQNHIYFTADITKSSVYNLNHEITSLNEKYKNIQNFILNPNPIYLHINTNGGDVPSGWTAVDFIKNSTIPIHTIVEGTCASAGTLMSVASEKRYMTKHARMLIHQLSSNIGGTFREMEDEMKYLKNDTFTTIDFYHKYSNLSKLEIREHLTHDNWWNYNTAKKYGFVDSEWR